VTYVVERSKEGEILEFEEVGGRLILMKDFSRWDE